jgi:AbrB family looped-hinge helix DNA binding protein
MNDAGARTCLLLTLWTGLGKTLSYLTMTTIISSRGQIVLPAEIRHQDGIRAGQQFDVVRVDRGEYHLRRREPAPNEGVVDWLLGCPEKGFFTPITSESTDTL